MRPADILPEIELALVRPFERMPAEPDDDGAIDDVGRLEQGRGDIADGADGDDVKRNVGRAGTGPGNEIVEGRRRKRLLLRPDIVGDTTEDEAFGRDIQPLEQR